MSPEPSDTRVGSPPKGEIEVALGALAESIRAACPGGATVCFRFDRRLHLDIDVRTAEQAAAVERALASLQKVHITGVRRGKSTSPFLQRITAEVAA